MSSIEKVLRDVLTEEQYLAATDKNKEVLALACAGSGKSTTLSYRIAHLLANGAEPEGIVAFTFTEKAAESIKRNVAKALAKAGLPPALIGAMYIGTIHSYCQHVLGLIDANYRQYEVLDTNKLILYIISRYPQLKVHHVKEQKGVRYFVAIKEVGSSWNTLNDEMLSINDLQPFDACLAETLQLLQDGMQRDRYIDFSMMIRLVVDGLEKSDERAIKAISSLKHLMVDEYQDVNSAQERLISALHNYSETLFVVGDDDQSIYGWRGADVSNILTFQSRYPKSTAHALATNFRSTEAIVSTANNFALAELGAQRLEKNPRSLAIDCDRDFRVLWFDDRASEADWVANCISNLIGKKYVEKDGTIRGLTPGDFAILMRSTRQNEANDGPPRNVAFSSALEQRGIMYSLEAGGSPFDIRQVDVLRESFELLREGNPSRSIVHDFFEGFVLPAYPNANFNAFVKVMGDWGRDIHTPVGGVRKRIYPQKLVHQLLGVFGLHISNFAVNIMNAIGLFSRMIKDVESVYVSVDSTRRFQELLNFLKAIAETGYDLSSDDYVLSPDAVTISTVHKMKGLEFPVVFVVDVENQRFPKKNNKYSGWIPKQLIQASIDRGCYASNPNEEARLFYTALTRAERFLYVTGCEQLPNAKRAAKKSRYSLQLVHNELNKDPNIDFNKIETCKPRPRVSETNLPTSYSNIKYYLKCPKDYELRYRYGFSPAIIEMFGFGQAVHATIGKLHSTYLDSIPTAEEVESIALDSFHLKHIPPSADPVNRPGGYERAQASAIDIAKLYVENNKDDFLHYREVEQRFEILIDQAVISGAIDLLIREDDSGQPLYAQVIDFKAMSGGETPEKNEKLEWAEMALQVQLYAKAAKDVLGENAKIGAVHLLKDNKRVDIPVDDSAIDAAIDNVNWAVERIINGDFPRRPGSNTEKCQNCDFNLLCDKSQQEFLVDTKPLPIHLPNNEKRMARAVDQ